jgi:hypothetical protein
MIAGRISVIAKIITNKNSTSGKATVDPKRTIRLYETRR